jgi:hypothetical protein
MEYIVIQNSKVYGMVVLMSLRDLIVPIWVNENELKLMDGDIMSQQKKKHEDIMLN